ncbi:hypothetical protein SAMN06296416_101588 [Pseudoxanthomonas wuyuanensis]|uniref:Uncharacterized protein n=1 Tax=Pseudoxanthomonas wuyuanensis TaxID=1073196 RepID=A0A286CYA0_9GAMM|nr:hypothetical protein SAMN06296416_101588 [Pseudoxanthomonas wuyuanensis]
MVELAISGLLVGWELTLQGRGRRDWAAAG